MRKHDDYMKHYFVSEYGAIKDIDFTSLFEVSESMCCKTIREIWQGEKFIDFRERKKVKCSNCGRRELCLDGCRLGINIDMCID